MPKTKEEQKWAAVLCCIYTHVEKYDNDGDNSYLETYDGSEYSVGKGGFLTTAKKVKKDICNMSMGSQDCSSKQKCMEDALEDPKTNPPSQNPTTGGTSPLLQRCMKKANRIHRRQKKSTVEAYKTSIKECKPLSGADKKTCFVSKKKIKNDELKRIEGKKWAKEKKCSQKHGRHF